MKYILRRIAAVIPVMAVVAVVVFMLIHLSDGDPAAVIAGDNATAEDVEKIRQNLGLDKPLLQQFGIWVGNIATGDLGTSIATQMPVSQLIGQRLGRPSRSPPSPCCSRCCWRSRWACWRPGMPAAGWTGW